MTPATTVSNITHDARMNGQRLVAPVITNDYPQHRPDNEVPVIASGGGYSSAQGGLLTAKAVTELKQQNTQQLLKSNYWFEIANISRWCTTGLIGLSGLTIMNASGLSGATLGGMGFGEIVGAIGTAIISSQAVWVALAALTVAAIVTVRASQHSRKVFVEKSFDVQDTLMQRQAQLVGKSVEVAVSPQTQQSTQSWVSRTQAALDQAETQQAAR